LKTEHIAGSTGKKGLISFDITVKETNLNIQATDDFTDDAIKAVLDCRTLIENFIHLHPEFATSLNPVEYDMPLPTLVQSMLDAGRLASVGPMASVAGTVAEFAGRRLSKLSSEVLVENGGDIFIQSKSDTIFSIYAEASPFNQTTGIMVPQRESSYGLCTSSGTLGHSKSFGKADAATVLSKSCPLADAVATALGNRIQIRSDIQPAIDWVKTIPGVEGIVLIKDDAIGLWGDLKLVSLT
jgi:ApbE superfamily uncharacterized protein (UPF0280 family)